MLAAMYQGWTLFPVSHLEWWLLGGGLAGPFTPSRGKAPLSSCSSLPLEGRRHHHYVVESFGVVSGLRAHGSYLLICETQSVTVLPSGRWVCSGGTPFLWVEGFV